MFSLYYFVNVYKTFFLIRKGLKRIKTTYSNMIPRSANKRVHSIEYVDSTEEDVHSIEEDVQNIEDIESFTTIQKQIDVLLQESRILEQKEKNEKYVIFPGLKGLHSDLESSINETIKINPYPKIYISAYHINKEAKVPFLQYFLYKSETNNQLHFPHFRYTNEIDVIRTCLQIMNELCAYFVKKSLYDYKGYHIYNGDLYLFFDCSELAIDTVKMVRENELWLATIDEMINARMLCDISMDEHMLSFLMEHKECLYLTDSYGEIYETPTIVYASCPINRIDFYATFGIPYTQSNRGPGYYFHHRYSNIVQPDTTKMGILRVALFLQNLHIVKREEEDDPQGKWKDTYDSLYQIHTTTQEPIYVVKEYDQQYVLSGHWIDTSTSETTDKVKRLTK
jgi:hypothetical protein